MLERKMSTDVLVAGAGPVGLALAVELGLRGIRTVVVEKQARTGVQPRAKTTNIRTMQHMRRWGIAEALRAASPLPRDYPTDVVFATRLFGRTLAVIENAFEGAKRRDPRFPEPAQWVPQYVVEAVLRDRAATLPSVQVAFNSELEDAKQSTTGVVSTVRDHAQDLTTTISAKYLVGADGGRSHVRSLIGAKMEGEHAFALHYNVILQIPALIQTQPEQRAIMYWVVNPESPAVLSPMGGGRWAIGLTLAPGEKDMDDATIRTRVRAAIGRDMDFEILMRDAWAAHRLIADKYSDRRMFLAGDACHLHPPFGGYGMNLGIADAVDLGWKLAATLAGWGGPELLASYEMERRPVHVRTIAEAVANHSVLGAQLLKANLDDDGAAGQTARAAVAKQIVAAKTREFKTVGVVLGSRYDQSPVIIDDGSPPPAEHSSDFSPSAHPGCLAPHAWLRDGTSLYDHFAPVYTLLQLGDVAASATQALMSAAKARGLPLALLDLRHEDLVGLYGAPLVLIRPDQFVAWRGSPVAADADRLIAKVCGAGDTLKRAKTPARKKKAP
jgi:2-polyprenyl-6-methoxyphenol hydroxylase-like FAD-dependent oxidoreductase